MDLSAQLLTAAAALALRDGGLKISADRRERAGLLLGNGRLSPSTVRAFRASIAERGLWRLSTSAFARRMPSAPAGACAAALDLRGPGTTIATGDGESLCAIALAAHMLSGRQSSGDLLLAGGVREADGEAEVLALVAGENSGATVLAGWGFAGPGLPDVALEQALTRAGRPRSDLAEPFPTFVAAVEAVRSGRAALSAAVTPGGCASCALVFSRALDAQLQTRLDRRQALLDRVRELIVKQTNRRLAPADIDPDAPLFVSGLGLDSVDTVELIIALEAELGLALPGDVEAVPALRTVNTIVDAVLALPGRATDGA